MQNKDQHSFHIPVMGIGFSIDTPLKVAKYGISSVISLVDDDLIERMRFFYCRNRKLPYEAIEQNTEDARAKRITAYLNLVDDLVHEDFNALKHSYTGDKNEIRKYIAMLPDGSELKRNYLELIKENPPVDEVMKWLDGNISLGDIDVNIMTKIDKVNYRKGIRLPSEYNDAHAALRGFALSKLRSSVVLSAGINPKLYGYFETFADFYPDSSGEMKKKIVLKVSDFRSALVQGKFLAKKGIWISEYRIESGLNCGGHAFASDGNLLGPILHEFKENRAMLIGTLFELYRVALREKNKICPEAPSPVKITAQGGVGTFEEHRFLLDYYKLDSIGWGTPFLLVPEVANVDKQTLQMLAAAKEKDLYLSKVSPLGVPFNNLKGNSKDEEKRKRVAEGRPGSSCPNQYLVSNTEFTEQAICLASRRYQHLKLQELAGKELSPDEYADHFERIVDKTCLCVGLAMAPLVNNDLVDRDTDTNISVCPGPNMAYFSEIIPLQKMVDHIYGRTNVLKRMDRPHVFIKELSVFTDYLSEKIAETPKPYSEKDMKFFRSFQKSLLEGIAYYGDLFPEIFVRIEERKNEILNQLADCKRALETLELEILQ